MMMKISTNILQKALTHYNELCELEFVLKPSLPILYFGNVSAYFKSEFKVITAALNPSAAEFKKSKNSNPSYLRFPEYDNSIETLYLSLNNYFKHLPYEKWFGIPNFSKSGFLPIMNGLGTCYYSGVQKNTAIHTDICSPLATNPTWSNLSSEQKTVLFKDGFEIWKQLILELKPDLILMSLKKAHLESLPLDFVKRVFTKTGKQTANRKKMEYVIDHYKLNLDGFVTNMIWGSAQNTPFQPFKSKKELGQQILKYLVQHS